MNGVSIASVLHVELLLTLCPVSMKCSTSPGGPPVSQNHVSSGRTSSMLAGTSHGSDVGRSKQHYTTVYDSSKPRNLSGGPLRRELHNEWNASWGLKTESRRLRQSAVARFGWGVLWQSMAVHSLPGHVSIYQRVTRGPEKAGHTSRDSRDP